jgi:hypothetical protein
MGADLEKESPEMIIAAIIVAALALAGIVSTAVVVQRDGLRRTPTATY